MGAAPKLSALEWPYGQSRDFFEEVVETIDKTTGGHMPKRQAEEISGGRSGL